MKDQNKREEDSIKIITLAFVGLAGAFVIMGVLSILGWM